MAQKLIGAYVKAWAWVSYEGDGPEGDDPDDLNITDNDFRKWAKRIWAKDGEIEFDDDAAVSRSYENG